jgi:signal transduction histidine kinase
MWNVPKPRGKLALFLLIGVLIAIAFMLFNLWPLWLKIGIWYFSFYTLIVLVGFILLRLVVWLVVFHFGFDFWIFPNFFVDSADIMDSFRPFLSFERREDDAKMVALRVLSAVGLVFLVVQLAKEPENVGSLASFADDSMNDLFQWGSDKFVYGRQIADMSGPNGTAGKRKKTPQEIFMEAILEPEEEQPAAAQKEEEKEEEEERTTEEDEEAGSVLDRDAIGGEDEEEEDKRIEL